MPAWSSSLSLCREVLVGDVLVGRWVAGVQEPVRSSPLRNRSSTRAVTRSTSPGVMVTVLVSGLGRMDDDVHTLFLREAWPRQFSPETRCATLCGVTGDAYFIWTSSDLGVQQQEGSGNPSPSESVRCSSNAAEQGAYASEPKLYPINVAPND